MSLGKDLVFLILQFCDEENLKKTAHALEQETGYFFDLKHFEELGMNGSWDEAEKYLSNFTIVEDNKYSTKIYFEIRKQKYLEALDKHEFSRALDILKTDLHVFAKLNKELYKEMAHLLALDDFRENDSLAPYGDTLSARKSLLDELKAVIEANPLLQGRTRFPQINKSRLRRLINQSLNWQHIHCTHPHPQPHIDTLFTDHKCPGPDNMQEQLSKDSLLPPTPVAVSASPLSRNSTSNQSLATDAIVTATSVNLGNISDQALGKDKTKSCHDASNVKSTELTDEEEEEADISTRHQASENEVPIDFPRKVERVLKIGSPMTTMDFNPLDEAMLLVGKASGYVEIWDLAAVEKLFKTGCLVNKGADLLETLETNHGISVNRVLWSPDGSHFGVAYSKQHLRLFNKNCNSFKIQWEIDAHNGSVNDLAFSRPFDKLLVVSCGDDKLVHVWDAATSAKQYTFAGHGAPVYSLCLSTKGLSYFIFSISINGEIRGWMEFDKKWRVDYDSPGFCRTRMAYDAANSRLFSCGTKENGVSYIVEWNGLEGSIVRYYRGLSKCSSDVVKFDTCIHKFLAAGDEHLIKIWDMDSTELLAVIDADGGLLARPYIRFSKKGNLLAVSAEDNQIKIMANDRGRRWLQGPEFAFSDSSSDPLRESFSKLSVEMEPFPCQAVARGNGAAAGENPDATVILKPRGTEEAPTYTEMTNISKIVEVHSCQSLLLASEATGSLIQRLVYTHTGNGLLALAADGKHLLWRWVKSGEATTDYAPQLWKPRGSLMVNEPSESGIGVGVATPCLSLSKNDSYLISASGSMISLYNVLASKKMRNVMKPPPAATCLMFYPPDNNIVVIGMDDSTILVYNIRVDEVISKLECHSKRISGLAFSTKHHVLVSCGVDTQIVVWDCTTWEKKKITVLQILVEWFDSDYIETHVELDKDEDHFLTVHETQLAIYETATLRRVKQWTMANFCARISHAAYSCDNEVVYAAMKDNILLILGATDLTPRYEIDPSAYLPAQMRCYVKVVVVAAHPRKPKQFALGLSSGRVVVIEPHQANQGEWAIKKLCY